MDKTGCKTSEGPIIDGPREKNCRKKTKRRAGGKKGGKRGKRKKIPDSGGPRQVNLPNEKRYESCRATSYKRGTVERLLKGTPKDAREDQFSNRRVTRATGGLERRKISEGR